MLVAFGGIVGALENGLGLTRLLLLAELSAGWDDFLVGGAAGTVGFAEDDERNSLILAAAWRARSRMRSLPLAAMFWEWAVRKISSSSLEDRDWDTGVDCWKKLFREEVSGSWDCLRSWLNLALTRFR